MNNDIQIEYTSLFNKQRGAVSVEIKKAFLETLRLYVVEPDHPALRNHPLHGKFTGFRSIDVTEDYRALFRETTTPGGKKIAIFHLIGTHKELYG